MQRCVSAARRVRQSRDKVSVSPGSVGISNQKAIYSYDEVPYQSWPYPQSHPDRLATIATLFGIKPQPVDQARVLELGCAAGGNLIPIAEMYPESRFVGVDLSSRELADARRIVEQLGLKNIELKHGDVADIGPELGKFHYIIAHGVFSWVTSEVQEKILQICRDNLEPNGVAYVSYNTYPGWRMRGMIRDMACYHTERLTDPRERVSQARALLQFLSGSVARSKNAYAAYLAEELGLFGQVEDHYLLHDHLEKVNDPVYFWQFVRRANAHGLQFLGESDFATMFARNLGADVASTLERITQDIVQMEQYLDFLRNRTFRQTLLCHADRLLNRTLDASSLRDLYIASYLKPQRSDVDVSNSASIDFRGAKVNITSGDPLTKAALTHLAGEYPRWVPVQSVMAAAHSRIDPGPVHEAERVAKENRRLGEQFIQFYSTDAVELRASPPRFILQVSDCPVVSPLARLQAETQQVVTNRKHESIRLNDLTRHAVCCLDGNRNHDAVLERLLELVENGVLVVRTESQPINDRTQTRSIVSDALQKSLRELANCALLIG